MLQMGFHETWVESMHNHPPIIDHYWEDAVHTIGSRFVCDNAFAGMLHTAWPCHTSAAEQGGEGQLYGSQYGRRTNVDGE